MSSQVLKAASATNTYNLVNNEDGTFAITKGESSPTTVATYTGTGWNLTGDLNVDSGEFIKDSNGNVGIGVTPSAWRNTGKAIEVGTAGSSVANYSTSQMWMTQGAYYNSSGNWIYTSGAAPTLYALVNGGFQWFSCAAGTPGNQVTGGASSTNFGTPSMTLDASGNLITNAYVKTGSYLWAAGDNSSGGIYLGSAGSGNARIGQNAFGSSTTTTYIGNQAITTSSDIRLKENIRPTERNALELLGQWEIIDHTWNDPSDQCENNRNSRGVWTGVIAQQVQQVTPWLVNKPLEDTNPDGSINPWVMDFGYAVPLLVKAIQELKSELDTVKAELAVLKGA